MKNTGTANANYSLVWHELTNNIINNELVIEGTCKRLNIDVSGGNCSGAIKKYGATASARRLRSANLYSDFDFNVINSDCSCRYDYANYSYGISPAFRIG